MPYITQDRRAELKKLPEPETAGELNYLLTHLALGYTRKHGRSYETMNAVTGALTLCRGEYERRVVAPYETIKCRENGDVFPEAEAPVADRV